MASIDEQHLTSIYNNCKKPLKQLSPAAGIKKLLKCVRKIFKKNSSPAQTDILLLHYCMTEEEHQNWLNERLALKASV